MTTYTFTEIKKILNEMIAVGIEPELSIFLNDKQYMIIGYKNRYSFQRCGIHDGSGELFYDTLDELYNSTTVDGISLQRNWNNITNFECADYEWYQEKLFNGSDS